MQVQREACVDRLPKGKPRTAYAYTDPYLHRVCRKEDVVEYLICET